MELNDYTNNYCSVCTRTSGKKISGSVPNRAQSQKLKLILEPSLDFSSNITVPPNIIPSIQYEALCQAHAPMYVHGSSRSKTILRVHAYPLVPSETVIIDSISNGHQLYMSAHVVIVVRFSHYQHCYL